MTPEQLSEFKKAFRAAVEKMADKDKVTLHSGPRSYSMSAVAREVEQETEFGMHFVQMWENYAVKRDNGVDSSLKKLAKNGL